MQHAGSHAALRPLPVAWFSPGCMGDEGKFNAMQGSQAYAKALAKAGVLTEQEAQQIVDGLGQVNIGRLRRKHIY